MTISLVELGLSVTILALALLSLGYVVGVRSEREANESRRLNMNFEQLIAEHKKNRKQRKDQP